MLMILIYYKIDKTPMVCKWIATYIKQLLSKEFLFYTQLHIINHLNRIFIYHLYIAYLYCDSNTLSLI